MPKNSVSQAGLKKQRGGRVREKGGGGGAEKPLLAKRRDCEVLLAGICKKFEKVFEKSQRPFFDFFAHLF